MANYVNHTHPKLQAIGARLGLPAASSADDFVAAVEGKLERNAAELAAVNAKLHASSATSLEARATAALDKHAGKYPPNEREKWREFIAHVPNGLEKFEARFARAPKVYDEPVEDDDSIEAPAARDTEEQVMAAMGFTRDEWNKGEVNR